MMTTPYFDFISRYADDNDNLIKNVFLHRYLFSRDQMDEDELERVEELVEDRDVTEVYCETAKFLLLEAFEKYLISAISGEKQSVQ